MKKKLTVISIIIIIVLIALFIILNNKEHNISKSNILVSYSSGGGLESYCSWLIEPKYYVYKDKTIRIKYDMNRLKENNIELEEPEDIIIKISNKNYQKIYNLVVKKDFKHIRVHSDKNVLDGYSEYYTVYGNDNKKITVGGYMPRNRHLDNIRKSIFNSISEKDITNISNKTNELISTCEDKMNMTRGNNNEE